MNQVTLPCADIERGVRFYQALGLDLVVYSDHYARLACPQGRATLSLERAAHGAHGARGERAVVYFECEALDERVADLRAAGVGFESGPRDEPWGWREARLNDPDGNPLCLYYAGSMRLDPPWRVAGNLA